MDRILVIADDLTGAAEIAGIGLRYGLPTRLLREPLSDSNSLNVGLTVIDTDSRLLSPADSADTVHHFISQIDPHGFDLIYKKTDSVLRGPILSEIETIMTAAKKSAVVFVPQNPSRGRTIVAGEYRINDRPLVQTTFAQDPDHPARNSNPLELLGFSATCVTRCCDPEAFQPLAGITIGGASNAKDLQFWAASISPDVLPAGGADFFEAILSHRGRIADRPFADSLTAGNVLFVCGSASDSRNDLLSMAQAKSVPVCSMPDKIFRGVPDLQAELVAWSQNISTSFAQSSRVLMTIPQPVDRSEGAARRIQTALAETVASVLSVCEISNLLLEGGATAAAVCGRMGWSEFQVIDELAGGVVVMRVLDAGGPLLVVKPGSYRWPDVVWG